MAQAARFPANLAALIDFFAELPNRPANELVLNTTINSTDLSIVATTNIPASWPASGRMVIDNEVIEYASYATATFTIASTAKRGLETGFGSGAAAGHTAGAIIGMYQTAQMVAQMIADLIAVEKALFTTASVNVTGNTTVDFSLGYTQVWATTGNVTAITLTNPGTRQWHSIVIKYGGAHTLAFTTAILWPSGITPTWTSVNGKYDIISLFYDGTNWIGEASLNH